jgi:hypothetical protein
MHKENTNVNKSFNKIVTDVALKTTNLTVENIKKE